jgi:hypothetical protein
VGPCCFPPGLCDLSCHEGAHTRPPVQETARLVEVCVDIVWGEAQYFLICCQRVNVGSVRLIIVGEGGEEVPAGQQDDAPVVVRSWVIRSVAK